MACAIPVMLLVSACSGNGGESETGNLRAFQTGEMLLRLAPRAVPDVEMGHRCGRGDLTSAGLHSFVRRPFLQQMSENGVTVVFETARPARYELELTTPDGRLIRTQRSEQGVGQSVVHLDGLLPATVYCYALPGVTTRAGFRTAPARDSLNPIRFAALGDSGSGNDDQRALRDQLQTVRLDLLLHTGDLAYDVGSRLQLRRTVFDVYGPLIKSVPFYPVAGNHDYEWHRAAPFLSAFVLPENGDHERYYSFDWGDVHFVALDTEQIGAEQARWLARDLERSTRRWTIVYGHRPPFSSGEHGGDANFRRHFVPVLEDYRVPLVLSGHDHDYERSRELNGVTYVVTGGGGAGTKPVGHSEFTAFSQAVIHFVYITIQGGHLELHAIDGTGQEFDQLLLER